jgi:thioredoxin-like negative regulator of GroEL
MGRIENTQARDCDHDIAASDFPGLQGQQRLQGRQRTSIPRNLSSLLSLLSLLVVATVATAQETKKPSIEWKTDYHEAVKLAKELNKPLLIDFFATWCGPCRMMDEQVYTDAEVIQAMGSFVTVKVDVDADTKTAMAYGVQSIPRNVVLNIHGEMIGDRLGFMESEEFIAYLKDAGENTHKKIEGTVIAVPEGNAPEKMPITADAKQEEVMALLADPDPEVRKATRETVLKLDAALVKGWMRQGLASAYLGERIAAKETLAALEPATAAAFDPWASEADRATALAGMIKDER